MFKPTAWAPEVTQTVIVVCWENVLVTGEPLAMNSIVSLRQPVSCHCDVADTVDDRILLV